MKAFHGDAELKASLLAEIAKHEAAGAIGKGTYGEMNLSLRGNKWCAIGCALNSLNRLNGVRCPVPKSVSDHRRFPDELGIPVELAYLIDSVFENLSDAESRTWPRRVIEAIPCGADLSPVIPALLQWMILDPTDGFIAQAKPEFHATYRTFAAIVARDWKQSSSVTNAEWGGIDDALAECRVWAGAWARTRTRAGAGAGAWARTRAGARARAWARAWAGAYSKLSARTLELLVASPVHKESK